jgi:hypothetical protein
MAQIVVSLFFLVLALVAAGIYWIGEQARERKRMAHMIPGNRPPGAGFGGPPAGFSGYAGGHGYGPPPMGGYGQAPPPGYGQAPMGGHGQAPPLGYGQAPSGGHGQAHYGGPGGYGVQAPEPAPGAIRLVVRPDCTFDRLSDCMARAGLRVTAPPGPPVQPGEPSTAQWQGDAAQIRYAFDPSTYLRTLEIQGPGAHAARHALFGMASLPALDGAQIAQLLQSPRPGDQRLGLAAAEHLGPTPEAQMYGAQLGALAQSREPAIAEAAQRAWQRLEHVR